MKKRTYILATVFILILIISFLTYRTYIRGLKPVITPPPEEISEIITEDTTPYSLPENFKLTVLANNLPNARVMVIDNYGNMLVSQAKSGQISHLDIKNGKSQKNTIILENLKNPHGMILDCEENTEKCNFYVAEEDKISLYDYHPKTLKADNPRKLADLPAGGGHFTRTIELGPDDKIYVSIGSSCNVCNEKDPRRAAIYSMNKDGSDFKPYATGLRNAVFFEWSYVDGRLWATEMGRDFLGDDLPSDEINIVKEGKNYGWPICYGLNIHDANFDKNQYFRDPCADMEPSYVNLPAHSAPLGLAFIPEEGWPEDYWYDLLVSLHGSWNSTVPKGYKILRIKLDAEGNYQGSEDFLTGFLTDKNRAYGRPVDIITQPGGNMYISDDKAGAIYKISYNNPEM